MPARISRGFLLPPKPRQSGKSNRKRKLRGLDAFSIAGKQEPEVSKVRQSRLGEAEGGSPRRKRQRLDSGEEEADEPHPSHDERSQQKTLRTGRVDELDISGGSDSEGNEWRLGHVNEEDDSDVDSDEAFGESDEERFEGFAFRGSSSSGTLRTKPFPVKRRKEMADNDINLDEIEEMDKDESEENLGEDAVDLATMLDASDESDNEEVGQLQDQNRKLGCRQSVTAVDKFEDKFEVGDEFDGFDEGEDDDVVISEDELADSDEDEEPTSSESEAESDAESDENDIEKLQQIQDLVASLPKNPSDGETEGPKTNEQSMFRDSEWQRGFEMMSGLDPSLSRAFKSLARSSEHSRKDKSDTLVKVPLPKRQQDRLDRAAAYQKAKETLNRWIDTVKYNRRAEHLSFPLKDSQAQEAQGTSRLLPVANNQPRTELEGTIHDILRESGMAGKSEEQQIRSFEELQAKKMPLEEVLARRAELRKSRELLFREEVRSRRIKRIKSKSFRRVHRKDQQKAVQKEKDELAAAGVEMSEEERENQDRRRAAERMGGKHRESRWAKTMKQTGRTAWDEDARSGITDMARKNEELRQRMEGKRVRREDESRSELSSDDESEDDGANDSDGGNSRVQKLLSKVGSKVSFIDSHSKLASMKFMQRADAARRQRNDEEAKRLRRELADEEIQSESEPETTVGRRIFGPKQESSSTTQTALSKNEFEEEEGSASESEGEKPNANNKLTPEAVALDEDFHSNGSANKTLHNKGQLKSPRQAIAHASNIPTSQTKPKDLKPTSITNHREATQTVKTTAPTNTNTNNWTTLPPSAFSSKDVDSDSDTDTDRTDHPIPEPEPFLLPTNLSLVQSAFATDDDNETSFAREKNATTTDEADKLVSTALPGWGSWTGEGISKRSLVRDQKKNARNPRLSSTVEAGVRPADRKDAKLKDVIVSEKRVKKNAKYLASTLPHPFESRQQYERSLRIPIGPEWTTKESFQSATKPRILLKQGIVRPMERPMV